MWLYFVISIENFTYISSLTSYKAALQRLQLFIYKCIIIYVYINSSKIKIW